MKMMKTTDIKKKPKVPGSGRKKGKGSTVKRIPNEVLEAVEQIIAGNAYVKMKK